MKKVWIFSLLLASLASPLHAQTVEKRLDWPSLIAAAATSSADTLSTIHALNSGNCHESNPLLGRQPAHATLWVSTALSVTGLIALNYTAKHMREHGTFYRRLSRGINWGIAGLEGSVTIHNLQTCY